MAPSYPCHFSHDSRSSAVCKYSTVQERRGAPTVVFSYSTSPPPMEKLAWNRGTMGKKRESDNLHRRRRSNCRGIRYDFIMRQPERARRAHAVRNKQMFSHNSAAKFIFRQDGGRRRCDLRGSRSLQRPRADGLVWDYYLPQALQKRRTAAVASPTPWGTLTGRTSEWQRNVTDFL